MGINGSVTDSERVVKTRCPPYEEICSGKMESYDKFRDFSA